MPNRVLFIYNGPHYVHDEFAKSINSDYLKATFKTKLIQENSPIKLALGNLISAFSVPRNYDVYFVEGVNILFPFLAKKINLIRGKLIYLLAGGALYYLYSKILSFSERKILFDLLETSDGFICVGKMQRELLELLEIEKPNEVVYPFVEDKIFERLIKIRPNLNSKNILFIGSRPASDRFGWFYKGIDLLVESFKLIKREEKDATLTIVGSWQVKKEWLFDGINFVGYQKDFTPYIQNSSLYLHLGRGDSFPVTTLEAMLGGLPTIVSEWTGTKEIVKNISKNFVVNLNAEEVAKRVLKYFDLDLDKKIKLSEKSKKVAGKFRREDKVKEFKEKFLKLINEI